MPRSGPATTKPTGWAGSTSSTSRSRSRTNCRSSPKKFKQRGFQHVLLLGMGGSSLCPEVLRMTFGRITQLPDACTCSTPPTPRRSKRSNSRSTSREDALHRLQQVRQHARAQHLQAIFLRAHASRPSAQSRPAATSSPSPIPARRCSRSPRPTASATSSSDVPRIGGRYSALSNFGMVPAAVMGLDTKKFLDRAEEMVDACGAAVPVDENPGAMLGIILGTAAKQGRDKVTIITSPGISDLGAWLEQLLAESTGKDRQRHHSRRSRASRRARRLRQRPRLRLRSPRIGAGRRAGRESRRPRKSRASRRPHRGGRHLRPRRRNSSAGKLPPPSPAPSSASTPSTSPTSKPAKSRPRT